MDAAIVEDSVIIEPKMPFLQVSVEGTVLDHMVQEVRARLTLL